MKKEKLSHKDILLFAHVIDFAEYKQNFIKNETRRFIRTDGDAQA